MARTTERTEDLQRDVKPPEEVKPPEDNPEEQAPKPEPDLRSSKTDEQRAAWDEAVKLESKAAQQHAYNPRAAAVLMTEAAKHWRSAGEENAALVCEKVVESYAPLKK